MSKKIVVFSDGTWNTPNKPSSTNVIKLARAVALSDSKCKPQIVFYDQGVGTEGGWLSRLRGGLYGKWLDKNIEDIYRFLMLNYETGDDVYMFGFSRGAYTIRSTVGLIRNAGLLPKIQAHRFSEALDLYRRRDAHPKSDEAKQFRQSYSREIQIHFVGVWDTVGSMGIPGLRGLSFRRKLYSFHNMELSSLVRNAYHALAVDERRWSFRPTLWEAKPKEGQTVEQVWFAGVHSEVGGGSPHSGLSDVALMWLMGKAGDCGLSYDDEYIKAKVDPQPLGTLKPSRVWGRLPWAKDRELGVTAPDTEAVHQAAKTRYEAETLQYDPPELARYLSSPDPRIAEPEPEDAEEEEPGSSPE